MTKNTPAVAPQTDYSSIATAVAESVKVYGKAANTMENAVDKIAESVYLAYTTGYVVSFKGLSSEDKAAHEAAGRIGQDAFRAMFVSQYGNTPDLKTLKRWTILGAAMSLDCDKVTLKALHSGVKADKVLKALEGLPTSADQIAQALQAEPESRKAIPPTGETPAVETGETGDETESVQLTAVQALVTAATAIRWDNLTAEEWSAIVAVTEGLVTKTSEYGTAEQSA